VSGVLVLGAIAYALHRWVMSTVTRIVQWPFDPWLTWVQPYGAVLSHSLLAHLPLFLLGVAAGALFVERGELLPRPARGVARFATPVFWASLLGIVTLLASNAHDDATLAYGRYGLPLLPLLLTALMLSVTRARGARRALESAPLRVLGSISYGFYLFHLPCMTLIDRLMLGAGIDASARWGMFTATSLALGLLVAGVSFVLIERPALRAARAVR
jgi:peptidoglycan/LPS O-acetylase OafA/YrhL